MQTTNLLIEATLRKQISPKIKDIVIKQQADGEQGMSGADVHYFDVGYTVDQTAHSIALVTKNAPLNERLTSLHLSNQGLPVPFAHSLDTTTDEQRPICLQQIKARRPQHVDVAETAAGLAAIHFAHLGKQDGLPWITSADVSFASDWIVQACWRNAWDSMLGGGAFVDGYGNDHGQPKSGGDFSADFNHLTPAIEAAAAQFIQAMESWWRQGSALTLIHADLHGDHIFTEAGKTYIIDWGAARFGPLYLDLPNYFTREESLLYRDALATLGHDIPVDTFLAGYDAATVYPGFKYFGIGLWNWAYGDPPHNTDSVNHFANMVIGESTARRD